jgi:hypothetical protein
MFKTEPEEIICQDCGEVFRFLMQSTVWDVSQERAVESFNEAWEEAENHSCERQKLYDDIS